jgi:hypothetical protein
MVAYLRFWWKYERSDPEQMWEKISRIGFDDRYREAFDYVVGRLREGLPTRRTREETLKAKTEARRRAPRLVAQLFVKDLDELPDTDREYLRVLKDLNPRKLRRPTSWPKGSSGCCEGVIPRCSTVGWRKP